MAKANPTDKRKTKKKPGNEKYEDKLAISGFFLDIMKVAGKSNANSNPKKL